MAFWACYRTLVCPEKNVHIFDPNCLLYLAPCPPPNYPCNNFFEICQDNGLNENETDVVMTKCGYDRQSQICQNRTTKVTTTVTSMASTVASSYLPSAVPTINIDEVREVSSASLSAVWIFLIIAALLISMIIIVACMVRHHKLRIRKNGWFCRIFSAVITHVESSGDHTVNSFNRTVSENTIETMVTVTSNDAATETKELGNTADIALNEIKSIRDTECEVNELGLIDPTVKHQKEAESGESVSSDHSKTTAAIEHHTNFNDCLTTEKRDYQSKKIKELPADYTDNLEQRRPDRKSETKTTEETDVQFDSPISTQSSRTDEGFFSDYDSENSESNNSNKATIVRENMLPAIIEKHHFPCNSSGVPDSPSREQGSEYITEF